MLLFALAFLYAPIAWAGPVTSAELSSAIANHIEDVPEFKFIRAEAKKLGVRVYLFGGTAAGYSHYVNWDLKRKKGDTRFQKERFDYDYTNIYHSSQDLDIVVDGNPEDANKLQNLLATRFEHFQGNKTDWEVRLLRKDMGDKQALLNNPDFLNQHTDSNSTGMVEITEPPEGDPIVKDLRDWKAKGEIHFLKDVREGKLHYYFSPNHRDTKFFQAGRNPEIISVIRYLTKVFQYGMETRPEDMAKIKEIIDRFDPHGPEMKNDYVRNWLLKKVNGRKLLKNAQDMEKAWDTLQELGLREKLIAIEKNPNAFDSLAWWMSKEPLRTKPVGLGDGKTAAELFREKGWPVDKEGKPIVAHETKTFTAFESITKSPSGKANVFISRQGGVAGEEAAAGNGFYVRAGTTGARSTGLTVRFTLDPGARLGEDFSLYNKDYLLIHNNAALRVIPESLDFGVQEFMEYVATNKEVPASEKGYWEKLRRRVSARSLALSHAELARVESLLKEYKGSAEWFKLPGALLYPELAQRFVDRAAPGELRLAEIFGALGEASELDPVWEDIVVSALRKTAPERLQSQLMTAVSYPAAKNWKKLALEVARVGDPTAVAQLFTQVLSQPETAGWRDVAETYVNRFRDPRVAPSNSYALNVFVDRVLAQPHAKGWEDLGESLFSGREKSNPFIETWPRILHLPHTKDWRQVKLRFLEHANTDQIKTMVKNWKANPLPENEFFLRAADIPDRFERQVFLYKNMPDHYWRAAQREVPSKDILAAYQFTVEAGENAPNFPPDLPPHLREAIREYRVRAAVGENILTAAEEKKLAEIFKPVFQKGIDTRTMEEWLNLPLAKKHPEHVAVWQEVAKRQPRKSEPFFRLLGRVAHGPGWEKVVLDQHNATPSDFLSSYFQEAAGDAERKVALKVLSALEPNVVYHYGNIFFRHPDSYHWKDVAHAWINRLKDFVYLTDIFKHPLAKDWEDVALALYERFPAESRDAIASGGFMGDQIVHWRKLPDKFLAEASPGQIERFFWQARVLEHRLDLLETTLARRPELRKDVIAKILQANLTKDKDWSKLGALVAREIQPSWLTHAMNLFATLPENSVEMGKILAERVSSKSEAEHLIRVLSQYPREGDEGVLDILATKDNPEIRAGFTEMMGAGWFRDAKYDRYLEAAKIGDLEARAKFLGVEAKPKPGPAHPHGPGNGGCPAQFAEVAP